MSSEIAAMSVGSWWESERTSQGQGREGAKLISLVGECAKCQARAIVLVEARDNTNRKLEKLMSTFWGGCGILKPAGY